MANQEYFVTYTPVNPGTGEIKNEEVKSSFFLAEPNLDPDELELRAVEFLKELFGSYLAFIIEGVGPQTRPYWG